MDMTGKTVLITGASRGIGAEAGHIFAQAGANVVLVARSADPLAQLARDIGDNAMPLACDIGTYEAAAWAVQTAVDTFGGIDVLINNAGVIEPISHLSEADPEDWSRVIDINLKGVFYGMRAAVPAMKSAGGGSVLTISSGAAHGPVEAWSHYCSSKAGAAMLTRCLDKEEREHGIRAIGLSPGTVATQMQREIKASGVNPVSKLDWSDHIPADWPAKTLLWMCSPEADEFMGEEISLRDEAIRKRVGLA
ncbi:SDR family oxidoreductase [Phaeobacter marinintestinus]|uniref:SDR family oxidoreductase n=1 Tax=Falsiphaeobacter marinintestinus TaxID=1492905 RepID=UPI0011B3BBD8|nr:SDR family oxidoreductase [Phaeobacter marinintestinus]